MGEISEIKIALVIGGGALKSFAVIPLIEFLEENNIKVDLLVGNSAGGVMAAMLATGRNSEDLRKLAASMHRDLYKPNKNTIIGLLGSPFGKFDKTMSMLDPQPMQDFARKLFDGYRVENCSPELVLQATDFRTGESVPITKGDLADAVFASGAAYPFFPPIKFEGRFLFDGVYSMPLPVIHAVNRKADVIIAMDFREDPDIERPGFIGAILHLNYILAQTITKSQLALSFGLHKGELIYIKVNFCEHYDMRNVEAIPRIINAGKKAVEPKKEDILTAIKTMHNLKILNTKEMSD